MCSFIPQLVRPHRKRLTFWLWRKTCAWRAPSCVLICVWMASAHTFKALFAVLRVQMWLRSRHYSETNKQAVTVQPRKTYYAGMRTQYPQQLEADYLLPHKSAISQSWKSNNTQEKKTNNHTQGRLGDTRGPISLLFPSFYFVSSVGSSSGKSVLTSTGWEDRPQYERQCWSGVVHVLDSNFTGYTLECANNESKMIDLWYISAPISSFLSGQQNLILPFEVIGYS